MASSESLWRIKTRNYFLLLEEKAISNAHQIHAKVSLSHTRTFRIIHTSSHTSHHVDREFVKYTNSRILIARIQTGKQMHSLSLGQDPLE